MVKCPQCQNNIPEGNTSCNICGYKIITGQPTSTSVGELNQNMLRWVVLAMLVLTVIGVLVGLLAEKNSQVQKIFTDQSSIEISCTASADCELPMEFAVLSNCPYQAFCYNYHCVVGCPMWQRPVDDQQMHFNYFVACQDKTDCDCSAWDLDNAYECACLNGQCASVVAELY